MTNCAVRGDAHSTCPRTDSRRGSAVSFCALLSAYTPRCSGHILLLAAKGLRRHASRRHRPPRLFRLEQTHEAQHTPPSSAGDAAMGALSAWLERKSPERKPRQQSTLGVELPSPQRIWTESPAHADGPAQRPFGPRLPSHAYEQGQEGVGSLTQTTSPCAGASRGGIDYARLDDAGNAFPRSSGPPVSSERGEHGLDTLYERVQALRLREDEQVAAGPIRASPSLPPPVPARPSAATPPAPSLGRAEPYQEACGVVWREGGHRPLAPSPHAGASSLYPLNPPQRILTGRRNQAGAVPPLSVSRQRRQDSPSRLGHATLSGPSTADSPSRGATTATYEPHSLPPTTHPTPDPSMRRPPPSASAPARRPLQSSSAPILQATSAGNLRAAYYAPSELNAPPRGAHSLPQYASDAIKPPLMSSPLRFEPSSPGVVPHPAKHPFPRPPEEIGRPPPTSPARRAGPGPASPAPRTPEKPRRPFSSPPASPARSTPRTRDRGAGTRQCDAITANSKRCTRMVSLAVWLARTGASQPSSGAEDSPHRGSGTSDPPETAARAEPVFCRQHAKLALVESGFFQACASRARGTESEERWIQYAGA